MSTGSKRPERNLALELVRVTESAALACAPMIGRETVHDTCAIWRAKRTAAKAVHKQDEREGPVGKVERERDEDEKARSGNDQAA